MAEEGAARNPNRGRRQPKETRRQELIEATIDAIARHGYEETTMAVVADRAGLSRGIVNFHFESKEKLLVETLRSLAEEYRAHWRRALHAAGPTAAEKLWALVLADFDRTICSPRKIAAWCAFWGEARTRPQYRALCSANDQDYHLALLNLCRELAAEAQSPALLARGLSGLLEGLWLHLMMGPKEFGREEAHACAVEMLVSIFPRHFDRDGPIRP
ncbi:transcriptional regulator BetI [Inquilinus limosus]|uniref:transcriptional regulator BetI n=1 Tax=Inquilinus limosus TaxID=171674 RepID=UPI003F188E77